MRSMTWIWEVCPAGCSGTCGLSVCKRLPCDCPAGAQCCSLRDNYRSTPQVLAAALAVLPTPAPLQPLRDAGVPVQVRHLLISLEAAAAQRHGKRQRMVAAAGSAIANMEAVVPAGARMRVRC
jgi:hypothetical protein